MNNIGRFARRLRLPVDASEVVPETMYHLVDSEVADRLVTRCGRSLRAPAGTIFEFADNEPDGTCAYCTETCPYCEDPYCKEKP